MTVHTEEKTREAKSLFLHKWNFIKWKKREMILSLLKAKKMFLYQIKANNNKSPVTDCTGLLKNFEKANFREDFAIFNK